jgi:benzoyl-CoA-dihydrodiol lyase
MTEQAAVQTEPVRFETHPSRYIHWRLEIEPPLARLVMDVEEERPLRPGYPLKLNSYDLGVDIELADAVQRLRFEHPEVRAVVVTSGKDRVFCSGANIYMLGSSTHAFKVNFCKYTNETRLSMEDASMHSELRFLAAVNGACAGGGYELALACDEILLVDDASSAVSLPEVPLLAVLPGTGGLTRVTDKRKVRRDLADVFSSLGEGVKGKRAVQWRLVDETAPLSRFPARVGERARALAEAAPRREGPGVELPALGGRHSEAGLEHRYVSFKVEGRVAHLTMRGPAEAQPEGAAEMRRLGAELWALRAFRELDDVLLDLRFNRTEVGVVVLRTEGDAGLVLAADAALAKAAGSDWFASEVLHHLKRVLKRLDQTARSFLAVIDRGSCFVGSLFELALAADRSYMLAAEGGPRVVLSELNRGALPMANGLSRLATRFLGTPEAAERVETGEAMDAEDALAAGLVTFAPDEIDWEDEVRLALEERASISPDALTGMEMNLRFAGPETMETKIFGRLSAWQNWIFQRPNAVGEKGALTLYGKPERAKFNWTRT